MMSPKVQALADTRRVFVVIFAAGLFVMAARNVIDPDVWWHLRTGELIVQNHAVFHTDPYSFTKLGQPWVNHEWLSDVLISAVYRASGFAGLTVVFAIITCAAFMLVFLRSANRPYWAAGFTVWAAITSAPAWGVRPQTFSLFLASLFLLILERSYARSNLLWYAVPFMLLWVNLHAGFALGIALIALFVAGDFLDLVLGFEEWPQSRLHFRKLALTLAVCLAVIPFNPYGARMYLYPLQTIHSRAVQNFISEWFSPNFHQPMYLPLLLMILASFGAIAFSPQRLRPRDLLLLSATLWATLQSARHAPIFALAAAPILSRLIFGVTPENQARPARETKAFLPAKTIAALSVIVLAAFLSFGRMRLRHILSMQNFSQSHAFPVAAVSFLSANRLPGPLFNDYNWGGYLIWKLYPSYPAYIDGRTDVYGDALLNQFAATYQISDGSWSQNLDEWGIRTVILPPDAPLVSVLRLQPGWKQVYADPQAVLLVKEK